MQTTPPKALLVDDNPNNLLALETVIAAEGIETVRANSGREAIARVEKEDFALVLLDVMMPGMDGFETARRIRALPNRPQPLLVFLTAAASEQEYVVLGYEVGALDYLIKPLDVKVLRAKVKRWLELAQRLAQSPAFGLVTTCCYCKDVHDSECDWQRPEKFWRKHLNAQFSHGICPTCYTRHSVPEFQKFLASRNES